jgi:two-component system, sensor histidine kinase and response regulator
MESVSLRILLVEDNSVEASLAQKRLASVGESFDVTHVETMAAALDRLRTTPFDAALLDLSLPDSDGIGVLDRITAVNPHLPIVILTGLDDERIAAEALRKGAQDYLVKGKFSGSMIIRAIRYARERKRAEDSLRTSETKYRTLFNCNRDAVTMLTCEGVFLSGNPAAVDILGCRDEYHLTSLTNVDVSPEYQPDGTLSSVKGQQMIAIALEKGSHFFEWTNKRIDGTEFVASVLLTRMEIEGRTLLQSTTRDITEQKQAEENLQFANAILRTQQETSPDGILVVDENSRIISFNQRFVDMWGLSADCLELQYDEPVLQSASERVIKSAEFLEEVKHVYKHRSEKSHDEIALIGGITFERHSAPMFRPDGKYYGRVWYFRDITERKRAEESLRQEQQFSKLALDSLPGIFYLYTYPENRLVLWNKQHESLLGFEAEEMKGRFIGDWHVPEAKDAVLKAVDEVMEKGHSSMEASLVAKDGHLVPFVLTGVRFEAQGRRFLMGIGIDIAERKRVEEALRESEERLSMALAMGNAGIWEWNLKSNEVHFDARFHAILGYEPGELPTTLQEWLLYHHPDDAPSMLSRANAYFRGDTPVYESEHRIRTKAGTWMWVVAVGQVVNLATTGGKERFIGLAMNINDRKHAEEVLQREKVLSESIINSLPGIFYLFDERGQFLRWNKNFEQVTGYSTEEIPQIPPLGLFAGSDKERIGQQIQIAFAQGAGHAEADLMTKSGKWIPYYFTGLRVVLNGQPFVIGVGLDTTERKRAEESLRESERKLREAQTMSHLGYWQWDVKTGTVEWSDEVFKIFNLDPKTFTPQIDSILALSPWPEDHNRGKELMQRVIDTHEGGEYEQKFLRPDGSIGYYHSTYRGKYDDAGNLIFIVGTVLDITERKRTEEELRKYREHLEELVQQRTAELVLARDQAQAAEAQAEAANRAKSVFLASMSHELRTPLNAVLGFSQLMQTEPTLNESQKESLDIINRSGTHLLGLINDVLEMSRIESGRVAREETNFDLWCTLDTIKEMVWARAKAKGLRFILDRDSTLPRYIRADERKLKQVIINLVGNAVKFTHHGEITLRARPEDGGKVLRFEVEDTGPGIDTKLIPTLFDPFVQGGPNREGVGLGLFISQKLVELTGGRITVRSEPGKGSLFSFDLHCESVAATEIAPKSIHRRVGRLAPGQTPPRVLVAEDTPESRLLMIKTLQSTGFEVLEAENGMEAVQLFEERQPDLVLMDMRMPVMDGYEAIQRIRSSRQGKTTPIIAVTASAFEEDRQKILALGADNFVSKPMRADELFEKIRLLLGITYIYVEEEAEGAETVDRAGLAAMVAQLPEDLTVQLVRAMTVLDLDGFKVLLPKVAEHSLLLAEKLGSLANGYRVAELGELFPTANPESPVLASRPS